MTVHSNPTYYAWLAVYLPRLHKLFSFRTILRHFIIYFLENFLRAFVRVFLGDFIVDYWLNSLLLKIGFCYSLLQLIRVCFLILSFSIIVFRVFHLNHVCCFSDWFDVFEYDLWLISQLRLGLMPIRPLNHDLAPNLHVCVYDFYYGHHMFSKLLEKTFIHCC